MQTRHLTIMFTDIKGFTSKTASFSRNQVMAMVKKHEELVLPVVSKFHGRLVKTIGDAFLVTFESPTDAVLCGMEIQDVLKKHNSDRAGEEKIEVRVAINSGEVTLTENDIYGDAVNIASRIESIAEAGEVFFTEAVYLCMNKKEVPSSEIGYRQFKNVPEKIKVYRVLRETPIGSPELKVSGDAAPAADQTVEKPSPAPAPSVPSAVQAKVPRRAAALLLDAIIFFTVVGVLGINSGPRVTADLSGADVEDAAGASNAEFDADDIRFDRDGITIRDSKGGETVRIGREGVTITDKGPSGEVKKARAGKKRIRSAAAAESRRAGKVPVKMLLWALYCSVLVWRFGATPGKMIMKIKVIDRASGSKPAADKAFLRAFFSLVSLGAVGSGYLWALWSGDGATWHDSIAQTRVVRS